MNITIIERDRFEAELENVVLAHAPNPINPPQQNTGLFTPNGFNFPTNQNWPAVLVNMTIPELNLTLTQNFMAKHGKGTVLLSSQPLTYGNLQGTGYAAIDAYTEEALLGTVGKCCPPSYRQGGSIFKVNKDFPPPWTNQQSLLNFLNTLQSACAENFTPNISILDSLGDYAGLDSMQAVFEITAELVTGAL